MTIQTLKDNIRQEIENIDKQVNPLLFRKSKLEDLLTEITLVSNHPLITKLLSTGFVSFKIGRITEETTLLRG